ncbi:FumA C-terminus/TtdB family hydratase beta subunit [Hyperthermus butylicus]|uniref:L(+)-tartrate dehydratase beta subunit n=1 Tax=Hyperthermus butylicus (strain DSM 5456 / JCM 9403 / PLM1-5) TaxID=415426 RepID=A2BJ69_HYPBU|nr:FumA C-terminus/TtdB family hydratase beta subunit [Hyperthermus butylicus]ABM80030.1 L(+)-tartrate dehydratase beta subunit [Hyperthermus butylicus DSM 5456]
MTNVYRLRTPLSEEDVRKLRVGDIVYLSGLIFTARDAAHRKILELLNRNEKLPFEPRGLAVYHVGPVVRKRNGEWEVVAAGPTTSTRMEPVEHEFIAKTGVRMVIGKGGMGPRTAEACRRYGAVYAVFTGGAAVLAAQAIKRVVDVYWLEELGIPEAVWLFEVEDFGPLTVVIDATGKNLYDEVMENARKRMEEILSRI